MSFGSPLGIGGFPGLEAVSLMSRFTVPEGERRGLNPAMNALQISHFMRWATEPNLRF